MIQPVVHTTAVGYVPPFYYTQFAPRYPGPEVGRLPQELLPAEGAGPSYVASPKDATGPNTEVAESASDSDSNSNSNSNSNNDSNNDNSNDINNSNEKKEPGSTSSSDQTPKRKGANAHPLSFYPNYHSLYYDPYFYSYNGFNAHLAPNPYLFDYQPQALAPLPPQGTYRDHQLLSPQLPDTEPQESGESKAAEKIPDVPPPPVPTSSSPSRN